MTDTTIVGTLTVADAAPATKQYRFRTSGTSLDLEVGGAKLYLSAFPNADYSGTQRTYLIFFHDVDQVAALRRWSFQNATFDEQHSIDANGGVVLNEIGGDFDTRVEGDTDPNLLFVDASTDRVGIGTASPSTKLHVNGALTINGALKGATLASSSHTSSYTLTAADVDTEQVYNSSSAGTFTVPTDSAATIPVGAPIPLRQTGTGQLTLAGASGVTVSSRGGVLNLAGQHAVAELRKTGANAWVLYGDIA